MYSHTWEELNNLLFAAAKGKASESQHAAAAAVIISRAATFQHPVHLTAVWLEHYSNANTQKDGLTSQDLERPIKRRSALIIVGFITYPAEAVQMFQHPWAKQQTFTCMNTEGTTSPSFKGEKAANKQHLDHNSIDK